MSEPRDTDKSMQTDAAADTAAPEGPAPVPAADVDEPVTAAEETTELPDAGAQPTVERPLVDAEATAARPANGAEGADAPRLRDVTATFGDYARGRWAAVKAFPSKHRAATVALALLAVAMVACLALAFVHASNVPDHETISSDARQRVSAPTYASGAFGRDDILVARDVQVRGTSRSATAIDSHEAQFGASGYATADVLVAFAGSSVRVDKTATLGYARVDGTWVGIGNETNAQVAWRALAGVDQEKVVENIDVVLERAERALDPDEGSEAAREMSLASIYAGGDVEVTAAAFDAEAQTDTLEILCTKASAYESYTCRMRATFSFRPANGQWELSEIEVNEDARTRTFDPLLGTWAGTFQSQETDGAKCLGARGVELSLSLDANKTSDGGAQLTGTVSGLAHYHEHPRRDSESCVGDSAFDEVPFVATLVGGYNEAVDSDLSFVATLPEEVGGTVTITLGFGTADDPGRVVALVQTTYPHTGSFLFIPYDETLTYTDAYLLQKAE